MTPQDPNDNARALPRLRSEDVIINAPMSFAGSAQRIFRMRRLANGNPGADIALTVVAGTLTVVAWGCVLGWYLLFGLLLVPYRLLRRGSRKRKRTGLQHREMLGAMTALQAQQQPLHVSQAAPVLDAPSPQPSLPPAAARAPVVDPNAPRPVKQENAPSREG